MSDLPSIRDSVDPDGAIDLAVWLETGSFGPGCTGIVTSAPMWREPAPPITKADLQAAFDKLMADPPPGVAPWRLFSADIPDPLPAIVALYSTPDATGLPTILELVDGRYHPMTDPPIPYPMSDPTPATHVPAEGTRFVAVRKADVDAAQEAEQDTVPVVATGTVGEPVRVQIAPKRFRVPPLDRTALAGYPMSDDTPPGSEAHPDDAEAG